MIDPCRLYLITPPAIDDLDHFEEALKAALSLGNVACLQVRLKSFDNQAASRDEILRTTERLLPIAKAADVAVLINDSPALAKECGADGVHIGQSDGDCREVRQVLGEDAFIGVTCHNSIDLGFAAGEAGADYVAFGAFFDTETKKASFRASPDILRQWTDATVLPSVAIGGITPLNCAPLVSAGADYLAVSSAVWQSADGPASAVSAFAASINGVLS